MINNVPVIDRNLWPLGWSPDGTRVFATDRHSGAVVTMPSTGGSATTVFTPSGKIDGISIAMSPDARHFVFSRWEGQSDVWIVDNFDPGLR
jgi:hypothetical protein